MYSEENYLMIGNTRWHWASKIEKEWKYFHTSPNPVEFQNKDFSQINSDKFDDLHVDGLEGDKNKLPEATLANIVELEENAKKLNLMELTERTCKWPIGDPATENFWFCGHPSEQGKPYCSTHVSIAFQPISLKRERKAK